MSSSLFSGGGRDCTSTAEELALTAAIAADATFSRVAAAVAATLTESDATNSAFFNVAAATLSNSYVDKEAADNADAAALAGFLLLPVVVFFALPAFRGRPLGFGFTATCVGGDGVGGGAGGRVRVDRPEVAGEVGM